eukprot:scaffold297_cov386-Prasinococcus_capsulatus_cf.AAC.5
MPTPRGGAEAEAGQCSRWHEEPAWLEVVLSGGSVRVSLVNRAGVRSRLAPPAASRGYREGSGYLPTGSSPPRPPAGCHALFAVPVRSAHPSARVPTSLIGIFTYTTWYIPQPLTH